MNAIEHIALHDDPDNTVLLSDIAAANYPFMVTGPAFMWASSPEIINGNGLFSDPDNAVLLLVDAVYTAVIGGSSEPTAAARRGDMNPFFGF